MKPNTNIANGNTDIPQNAVNSVMKTTAKTPEATTNEAPTVGPVFKAYCDALTKKDEPALRRVFSRDTLKSLEKDMKDENETSLLKYLETEQVSNKLCEVRNEKIEGNEAVAEVKTEGAPNGFKIKFVKENDEWKLTNKSPEIDAVKQSASNSNTAK